MILVYSEEVTSMSTWAIKVSEEDDMVSNTSKSGLSDSAAPGARSLAVAVSGAHGLLGSALIRALNQSGHRTIPLVRSQGTDQNAIYWDPLTGALDIERLKGVDVVIHLAGESIASGRWTEDKKKRIRDSRVRGTKLLADALFRLSDPPTTFLCASAIGYYGVTGDTEVDESGAVGTNFLAGVCREWEEASRQVSDKGIRLVNLRIGMVVSRDGGALTKMLPVFQLGGGGIIGDGTQYMSWVTLDDVVGAIMHIIGERSLSGPVNIVSPNAVTNKEFTAALGRALHRPTIMPLPAFAARLMLGQMADELLLASTRVKPTKLLNSNYQFRAPDLDTALKQVLS
jgi:uncharacterized protein (TIGR01777 family)